MAHCDAGLVGRVVGEIGKAEIPRKAYRACVLQTILLVHFLDFRIPLGQMRPFVSDSMSKKKAAEETPPLELAMVELEQIVRRLEQGGGTLDEDLADYARATELIKLCHGRLAEAEKTIQLLSGVDTDGNPIAEPFASSGAATLEQKQADRHRRRSASQDDSLF